MTEEEILAMKPGKELNIRVAEEVMGAKVIVDEIFGDMERYLDKDGYSVYTTLQAYSEDRAAAQLVVEKMMKQGYGDAVFWEHYKQGIFMPAEAICKMALLVTLEERNKL